MIDTAQEQAPKPAMEGDADAAPQPATTEQVRAWLAKADSPDVIIIPGTGNGGEVSALLTLLPERSKVLLLERTPARVAHLFASVDLETLIAQGRLKLALGEDRDEAEGQLLAILDMPKAPTLRVFDLLDSSAEDQAFYGEMLLHIRGRIRTKVFNLGTLVQHGCRWQQNTLVNLPALLANPGVKALENLFPGRPALVVAAGPSLNDALEILRDHAPGFVVLATGTALLPLRRMGIIPDLVVAVDASPKVAEQFETECGDLYLACASMVCPEIVGKMRGVFSGHVSANPVGMWVGSLREDKGAILGAGTVTATALDLAVRMGCNPVLSVGLDLCMAENGTTHADHTMYHGVHRPAKDLYRVPANDGGHVLTTNQFRVYIDAVSTYVTNHAGTRFININTGGAAIPGMERARPDRVPDFAAAPLDSYAVIREAHAAFHPDSSRDVSAEVRRVADELAEVTRESVNAAMLCNSLIMRLRSRNGNAAAALAELEELRQIDERLMASRESSLLIEMSLRAVYYAAGQEDERPDPAGSTGVQASRRSRDLYEQIAGAAARTRLHLLKLATDLEEALPPLPSGQPDGPCRANVAHKEAA